jgi:hypothetical protein
MLMVYKVNNLTKLVVPELLIFLRSEDQHRRHESADLIFLLASEGRCYPVVLSLTDLASSKVNCGIMSSALWTASHDY